MPHRRELLRRLYSVLLPQAKIYGIEVIPFEDAGVKNGGLPTGAKRNSLVRNATTEYVTFIDDDDIVGDNYCRKIMEGLRDGVDCVTFMGIITTGNGKPDVFELKVGNEYYEDVNSRTIRYKRPPNHLCPMRRQYYLDIPFDDTLTFAEDYDQCMRLKAAGLIKTSLHVAEPLYYYKYIPNK